MKSIVKKESEPEDFTKWKVQENHTLEICYEKRDGGGDCAFEHLPSNLPQIIEEKIRYYSKRQLKEELLDDQGFLCAFCMASLSNDHHCTTDHVKPKSLDPRANTLDYFNLVAACSGEVTKDNRDPKLDLRHCNNKKGENQIFVSPLDNECETKFIFSIEGDIFPATEEDENAVNTIATLGLGSKIIVNKRREAIERILYPDLPTGDTLQSNRLISQEEVIIKLEYIMEREEGRFTPFCVAIKHVLESKLEIGF